MSCEINPAILGPGSVIGYCSFAFTTLLALARPKVFSGVANWASCTSMAISYSIASVVTEETNHSGFDQPNLLHATAMTNILFALAVTSILASKGLNIPGWAVINWFLTPSSLIMSAFALGSQLKRDGSIDRFGALTIVLLFFQFIFLVSSYVAIRDEPGLKNTWTYRFQQRRHFVTHSLFLILISIGAMTLAGRWGCAVNFHSWTYGQVFSGSTGCAALYITWVQSFGLPHHHHHGGHRFSELSSTEDPFLMSAYK